MREVHDPRPGRQMPGGLCVVYSQRYQISFGGLEKLHPFDINKYARIFQALSDDGLISPADVHVPAEIDAEDIQRVHSAEYIQSLKRPHDLARYLEFEPLAFAPAGMTDGAVLRPFRTATGGTLLAARLALQHGMAVNLGGGYHHAGPGEGGGFCIYADMAIAIRRLQAEGAVRRALIVDVDVHQGNGTALCFENDDTVYTFDIHQDGIYPIPKERNDVDIALPAGTGDSSYLAVLRERLPAAFDASRPDIVILQAGVDVLAGDPLADFEISPEGVIERDATVFAEARRRGIPIVMVLGGGYSKQAWEVQYRSIRNLIECYGRKVRPM